MKTKKVFFGMLIAVFAIGSAVASAFAPELVRVKVYQTESDADNNIVTCQPVNTTCESTGDQPCTVILDVEEGNNTTSAAYQDNNCTQSLMNDNAIPFDSGVSVYQLVEPN
ncbi:DUF6520 family protein [Sinomicrobium soli]|uniref:DUF6520 family protein n=1 Tax=Sinomicrobium sp. N-1-3-6 TaxID=2219864 RepID=UPI000DCB8A30|nr:DUF6520 family protein [Sinomicrobium sp. N-1-3-6]RAV29194.1 hypothetical protein DN748_09755 [Sinomicrobium sp. N-1-3-6]